MRWTLRDVRTAERLLPIVSRLNRGRVDERLRLRRVNEFIQVFKQIGADEPLTMKLKDAPQPVGGLSHAARMEDEDPRMEHSISMTEVPLFPHPRVLGQTIVAGAIDVRVQTPTKQPQARIRDSICQATPRFPGVEIWCCDEDVRFWDVDFGEPRFDKRFGQASKITSRVSICCHYSRCASLG